MNILLLDAGASDFNQNDGGYPLCLTEIDGVPLIEHQANQALVSGAKRFVVVMLETEIKKYHLDHVVSLLSDKAILVAVPGNTAGAACSALMAIEYINDEELLILNGNELLDMDFSEVLQTFRDKKLDAGVVSFPSLHPRYSFARVDAEGMVTEVAEKKPISRNALVGFFWFAKGNEFVDAVKNMIKKDAQVNNRFYLAPCLNEMILKGARIGVHSITAAHYRPIKSERQLIDLSSATLHA